MLSDLNVFFCLFANKSNRRCWKDKIYNISCATYFIVSAWKVRLHSQLRSSPYSIAVNFVTTLTFILCFIDNFGLKFKNPFFYVKNIKLNVIRIGSEIPCEMFSVGKNMEINHQHFWGQF